MASFPEATKLDSSREWTWCQAKYQNTCLTITFLLHLRTRQITTSGGTAACRAPSTFRNPSIISKCYRDRCGRRVLKICEHLLVPVVRYMSSLQKALNCSTA